MAFAGGILVGLFVFTSKPWKKATGMDELEKLDSTIKEMKLDSLTKEYQRKNDSAYNSRKRLTPIKVVPAKNLDNIKKE